MRQRRKVSAVTSREYQRASKSDKGRILQTFTRQTKLNRVYAAWLLRNWGKNVWCRVDGKPVRIIVGAIERARKRRNERFWTRWLSQDEKRPP
jgi:hypothetical protein